ncbi:unnamed protein product [Penicillium egyptiacum]|uniref:Uncharacterized protein n=1 Tax=Penicillium egyptiacum TaxID=1303716 RepID=A0A9W4KML6_9EURO|nr:unnamed protein product [Penicillium egyptiacum]
MPTSPPRVITAENPLRGKVSEYVIPRVRRGLRAGFQHLTVRNQMHGMTTVLFDLGEHAKVIDYFKPDTAYFALNLPGGTSWNRAPRDIKPSWKWNTGMATDPKPALRREYCQALSQVNWYMKQHHSRYGFLLTDRELVVFRRLDDQGYLELALPIPFTAGGSASQPRLTVLLALWYVGMLAANNQGDGRWDM